MMPSITSPLALAVRTVRAPTNEYFSPLPIKSAPNTSYHGMPDIAARISAGVCVNGDMAIAANATNAISNGPTGTDRLRVAAALRPPASKSLFRARV